jgi:phage terminase large subunit-like protein
MTAAPVDDPLANVDLSKIDLSKLRPGQKRELLALLAEKDRRKRLNRWTQFYPDEGPLRRELYGKHLEFFAAGKIHTERAAVAGNRTGKSTMACYEVMLHLTGLYQHVSWWPGRIFDRPVITWVIGEDAKTTRDTLQLALMGSPGDWGTGMIPHLHIKSHTMRAGTPEAVDTVRVRNVNGWESVLVFKSYDQGREAMQGAQIQVGLMDEEPPVGIYSEVLARTMATVPGEQNGLIMCTWTPLKGASDTLLRFLPSGRMPRTEEERKAAWGW